MRDKRVLSSSLISQIQVLQQGTLPLRSQYNSTLPGCASDLAYLFEKPALLLH